MTAYCADGRSPKRFSTRGQVSKNNRGGYAPVDYFWKWRRNWIILLLRWVGCRSRKYRYILPIYQYIPQYIPRYIPG